MEFEKIYDTYFDDVYLYVRRLSGNEHIADEIASETFFKAMSSIKNFRGECDIRVWLCQIAKNSYFSYLKKNGKTIGFDDVKLQDLADPNAFLPRYLANEKEDFRLAE